MGKESILIVEDEAIISLGIQDELESLGYQISGSAYKGEDAIALAEIYHPDLVLMDINLRGGMDGIETAKQLKERYKLPVVFLTGAIDDETVQRAKVVEPYGYILKPFSQDDLRITIENALYKFQLENQIHQSEARFRELFETSLDGIVITDLKGNIQEFNPAFQRFLGYGADELLNMGVARITPAEFMEKETRIIKEQVLIRGYSDEMVKEYCHHDGSLVPASLRIWVRKDTLGRPVGFWAIIRDISSIKIAEQRIARQADFSQKLSKLTALLNGQLELSKTLKIICLEITQALNVEAAHVTFYDPGKEMLAIAHSFGPIDAQELIQSPYPMSIHRRFFDNGKAYLYIPDVQKILVQHPYYQFLVKNNIRSAVIVNLSRESQLIGTLDLATIGKTREFDEEEMTFLLTFANHAAVAIDRARLFEESKRRNEELEVLGRLSAELRLAVSQREMLPVLLQNSIALTNADAGVIYLLGQAGTPIHECKSISRSELDGDWYIPDDKYWDKALSGDELVTIPMIEDRIDDAGKKVKSQIRFRILVPFSSTQAVEAILVLGFTSPTKNIEKNQRVVLSLAEMGGNALHRSGLMEMLEQRVIERTRDLNTLYDLTVFVNTPVVLDDILAEALRRVIGTVGASFGVISYYDRKLSQLQLKSQVNLTAEMLTPFVALQLPADLRDWVENSTTSWLARKGDGQSFPFQLPDNIGFDTIINIPIRFEGNTLGILTVIWAAESNLTAENIALLSAVAERLGSAIQNDHLRQISRNAAILEERRRLARELHDSVTQSLYSLTLLAEAGKDLLAQNDLIRLEKCQGDLAENSVRALKEMRMLLFELRPPVQGEINLAKILEDRLEAVERRAGVKAVLEVDENLSFSSEVHEELFRVATEALNNSLKHSGANSVLVKLQFLERGVLMIIEDNGRGFDVRSNRLGGMGLSTMRERVERLGGMLEIGSEPGQGTRVSIKIDFPGE